MGVALGLGAGPLAVEDCRVPQEAQAEHLLALVIGPGRAPAEGHGTGVRNPAFGGSTG